MFGPSKPVVLSYGSRRKRGWRPPRWLIHLLSGIAAGAGVQVQEVNRLLNQFEQMQGMMKKMKGGGLMKMMKRMGGPGAVKGFGR